MKNEKIGPTPIHYLLSAIGIILLASLIILPPVFRGLYPKKDSVLKPTPTPENKSQTLVCHKSGITSSDYTSNEAYIFTFHDSILEKYILRTERVYSDPIFYQESKNLYGRYVTAFNEIKGYEYAVTPNDDEASFLIVANYDFTHFKPTTILVPGEENPTAITSRYVVGNDFNFVKNDMLTNDYTCE